MARLFRGSSPISRSFARAAIIFVSSAVTSNSLTSAPAVHAASRDALAAPVFPGPLLGKPSAAPPTPASFAYTCNVHPNTDPGKAAGKTLASGTAILDHRRLRPGPALSECTGKWALPAVFAVSDTATSATSVLRLFLLASGGFLLRTMDVKGNEGASSQVDFDVAGGITLALTFPMPGRQLSLCIKLTGKAHALAPTPMTDRRAGGRLAGVHERTAPRLQRHRRVPASYRQLGRDSRRPARCKWKAVQITVQVPASAKGALACDMG